MAIAYVKENLHKTGFGSGTTLALTVTVQLQTDSGGNPVTTFAQLAQALNANLGVTALFVTNPTVDISTVSPFSITTAGGGGLVPNFQPNALIQLYDQNRVQVFSQAVNDMYINRLSPEANGAFVPPLFYRKDTLITMEVFSPHSLPQVYPRRFLSRLFSLLLRA